MGKFSNMVSTIDGFDKAIALASLHFCAIQY